MIIKSRAQVYFEEKDRYKSYRAALNSAEDKEIFDYLLEVYHRFQYPLSLVPPEQLYRATYLAILIEQQRTLRQMQSEIGDLKGQVAELKGFLTGKGCTD